MLDVTNGERQQITQAHHVIVCKHVYVALDCVYYNYFTYILDTDIGMMMTYHNIRDALPSFVGLTIINLIRLL